MVARETYVAVALLTKSELQGIGAALQCVLPIEDVPSEFSELLARIDEAEGSQAKRGDLPSTPDSGYGRSA